MSLGFFAYMIIPQLTTTMARFNTRAIAAMVDRNIDFQG